tara:strand:- start:152 stop:913 length:762 start_codon:yes stop_codon:yes gene_type:complete
MEQIKLVSVIIPYYKKKIFILPAIKSILNQTYKKFEIIIIYDDPNKEDLSYVRNISALDKRIKLIINKKNLGAGFSRNTGIKKAKGYYVAFLDSDDIWYQNKLDKQIKFMRNENADFSFTAFDLINSKGKKIGTRQANHLLTYKNLIKSCDIGLSTVILKKKLLNNYYYKFPNLKTKEDYVLWLKISKRNILLYGLNYSLTKWRVSRDSLSSNTIQKIFDAYVVYRKYSNFSFIKSCYSVFVLSFNYILKKYL